jgi:tetratricopeptide (TPR) repeat protein
MQKKLYVILIGTTLVLLGAIFFFSKEPKKIIPTFKNRTGFMALSSEWLNSKKAIEGLLAAIEQNPKDYKSMLSLSQAYIQEGRVTGEHRYYDKAAIELLDIILQNEPRNFDAICSKATVLLSQHHFTEGLELAKTALAINPDNAFIYGILCDANLELGNYKEAMQMGDKMVSVQPDIRSYARISYLREVNGDYTGAIQAMKLAVDAGYPGLEETEWTRCILGHLYENTFSLDTAEYEYQIALCNRPDYAFAYAGLGRIAKSKGNYKEAITFFEKAKSTVLDYSFTDELTDLYRLDNQKTKAEKNAQEVIEMLGPNTGNESETSHGHYADKELAYAYLKIKDNAKALEHATIEYQRRPNNIDVAECMAWVEYKNDNYKEANKLIDVALKTKSKNPILICRAGLIKIKANQLAAGKELIKKALEKNPFLDIDLRNEAIVYLK